jgi:hypothetical protein
MVRTNMFNTGDLACWQTDGCVQMLGRGDSQVKVKVRLLVTERNVSNSCRGSASSSMVSQQSSRYMIDTIHNIKFANSSRNFRT